ncbi:MAG: hypothetical protein M3Y42_14600 [Actinomycetota bacterium]|nr:hypothetical protein [Actinomycetota bacterium]
MTAALIDLDRPLRLHPLTYLEEGEEVTVGRADIDSYGLFPVDGAALLRYLEQGHTPNEGARWYTAEYGEQVDIVEFLEVLEEFEMILADGEVAATSQTVRWQGLGKAFFSPVAWVGYAALVTAAVIAMSRDHQLIPSYQNLFFTKTSLVILTIGIVFGQLPWILLHELFHALAGRRLGLNSRLRLGRRFYFVVFITTLDGLVAVPRRKRYLPMLAGMLMDVLLIAALTLIAEPLHHSTGAALFIGKLLLSMAMGIVLRFVWQFYFFLRTDLYYTATTVIGCNDLQKVARELMRNRFYQLVGKPEKLVDPETWTPRDRSVAQWYSWLLLIGYAFLGGTLLLVGFPTGIRLTEAVFHRLVSHPTPTNFVDGVAFLILNFGELALAAVLAVRGYLRRPRAVATA